MQFQFSVCMYGTCGRIDNKADFDFDFDFSLTGPPGTTATDCWIRREQTDISCWMKDHHLQLNLAKTELLVVSANPSLHHNFTF